MLAGLGLLHAQVRHFEVLVIEAVEQEVQKIRHDGLGSFALQQLYQIVVGGREELDKDLAYHAYPGLFNI